MREVVDANPKLRKKMYIAYASLGIILGATMTGFAAAEVGIPVWLIVATSVYAYLGGAFGFGANSKVDAVPVSYREE